MPVRTADPDGCAPLIALRQPLSPNPPRRAKLKPGVSLTLDRIWGHPYCEAIARSIGYRPTEVKNRVQQIVDSFVANRVTTTADVAALCGAGEKYVVQTAEVVEGNARRMTGRL